MKINKSKFYTYLFVIVLFLQLYLPSFRLNIFIQVFVFFIYLLLEKPVFSVRFIKFIFPLITLMLVGFIGTMIHKFSLVDVLKDIFHFLKPIIGLSIGFLFFTKIGDFKRFIKIIVIAGFISAIIHFIVLLLTGGFSTGSLSGIREFSKDNFLELFALFFLIYYKKFCQDQLFKFKSNHQIILFIILASNILYFSRTMMVVAAILFFSMHGYTYITKKSIKYIALAILGIAVFYTYLYSVKIERNKPGLEAFLYKIKIAPSELFKTKIDRDNHKELWDHWRGYESKRALDLMADYPSSYIFGTGHGSLVNLKFKAPLAANDGMRYISELHNGYTYVLYKTGFIGLFILLFFLFGLYRKIYKYHRKNDFGLNYISAIGVIYLFTTLTITGVYNGRDVIIFILGALLCFHFKESILIKK